MVSESITVVPNDNHQIQADSRPPIKDTSFSHSWWSQVPPIKPDDFAIVNEAFRNDKNPDKVYLCIGTFRDENNKCAVYPTVRMAERRIVEKNLDKNYSLNVADNEFSRNSAKLVFGENSETLKSGKIVTIQSMGGFGATHVYAEFLKKFHRGNKDVYMSDPPFLLNQHVFGKLGPIKFYRYWNQATKGFDFEGCLEDIAEIPRGSIIVFHPCGHNPSGIDPSPDQWIAISKIVKKRNLISFFDMAYQGLVSGDIDKDVFAVRQFARDGHQLAVAQSYSKIMGLYGERVGSLSVVTNSPEESELVAAQLTMITASLYLHPPLQGFRIANEILSDPELKRRWLKDLRANSEYLQETRKKFRERIEKAGSKLNWSHITKQVGMYCYTGISEEQFQKLTKNHSIYPTGAGRVSVAGLTPQNIDRVARAFHEVTK